MVPDNRFALLSLTELHEYAHNGIETLTTDMTNLQSEVDLNKASNNTTQQDLNQFRIATVGQDAVTRFPVTNGKENQVYLHAETKRYYKCIIDGASAVTPNAAFEEISLLTLSNKSGGGSGDYDELKRKVAALEVGKEDKGIAKNLDDALKTELTTKINTKENKGVAKSLDNALKTELTTSINAVKNELTTSINTKEDKGVAKTLDDAVEKLIVDNELGTFPVASTVRNRIYKYNGKLYGAWYDGKQANVPNTNDFFDVNLNETRDKSTRALSEASTNTYNVNSMIGGTHTDWFPVTNSVKGKIYTKNFEMYKCLTDGINATEPNEHFERLSLLALSDKPTLTKEDFPNQLVGDSGYQKLPNGLIIQWGGKGFYYQGGSDSLTFPIAFPNGCVEVLATTQCVLGKTPRAWFTVRKFSETGFTMDIVSETWWEARLYCVYLAIGY